MDVSQILADAQSRAGGSLDGKFLHVRQQNNKALLVATGMTDSSYVYVDTSQQNNKGVIGKARVALIHNGVLGDLTPLTDIDNARVGLSPASLTYNGKVQKPAIKTIGGKTLKEGTDYEAVWSNGSSSNAGTYQITITGKGTYDGVTTDKTTGKVTVKVKVKAAGNTNYLASDVKSVKFTIVVK